MCRPHTMISHWSLVLVGRIIQSYYRRKEVTRPNTKKCFLNDTKTINYHFYTHMTYVTNVIFHEFEHLYDCIVRIMDLEIKYKVIKYILFYFKLNTFLPNALKKKKTPLHYL